MSKQIEASNYIRNLLASRQLILIPRTMTLEDKEWIILGAALGRIAMLDDPARTGKQFCPHRTDVLRFATMNGHRVKLVRETGET
jgi:hypothetical protein